MRKLISILIAAGVIGGGVVFLPRLLHTCDDCEEFFVGTGYKPNVVSDLINDEEQIICKECAEDHHAVSIALGKSVDDFKLPLFEEEE